MPKSDDNFEYTKRIYYNTYYAGKLLNYGIYNNGKANSIY